MSSMRVMYKGMKDRDWKITEQYGRDMHASPFFEAICPHCERKLDVIYRIEDQKGFFQGHKGYCYACPQCRKILGFADYAT